MRLAAVLIAASAAGGVATAAPPPPRIFPSDLPKTLNGYDLPRLLSAYDLWVESSRGAVLKRSLPPEEQWQGKGWRGVLVSSTLMQSDYGALRADELARYCEGAFLAETAGPCIYRYRFVLVDDTKSDLGKRALDSFRPQQLTAFLAKEGWKEDYSLLTRSKLTSLFARHTDLKALYEPALERHDVSSADCPALERAVAGLKSITINLDPAKLGMGLPDFPNPHGAMTQVQLGGVGPNGKPVTLSGGTALHSVLQPIWDAVESCSPPNYKKRAAAG